MKYLNFKRYKFSTAKKAFNMLRYNFLQFSKTIHSKRYYFQKIYKNVVNRRFNIIKVTKKFYFLLLDITPNLKRLNFLKSDFLTLHLPASIIFFTFLYFIIPTFYNYDKASIKNTICKNNNIKCSIVGDINYRFYPTPRLIIKELSVYGFNKKTPILSVEKTSIKLSVKNLLAKEKHKLKEVELKNFQINLDSKNFNKYKIFLNKEIDFIPVNFKKGEIVFYQANNYVTSITQTNINTKFDNGLAEAELKGKFLNDSIYINLNRINIDNKISTDLILKMSNLNFLTKTNFSSFKKEKNKINGNFLIKKDKNKIVGIFDYKDRKFTIKKSSIKNTFMDGKIKGQIILLPFFDFNLDLNLNSINFTRLYNYFLSLDKKKQKNLFKVNNKINGKLNFSSDKVHSKNNLVKSFESRLKFYNGSLRIEQFLLNLGKLGAADILGSINSDKKFSNFKFESNVFVDNEKKFLSKFGIYNKKSIPSNLFMSGNFDFENIRVSFYEISDDKKFNNEDINYIESEFNDLMLDSDYDDLFNFKKLKTFLKTVVSEKN